MARELTVKQRAFVDVFLRHPVGAHAAKEAGYGRPYNRSAHQARKSPAVEAAIQVGLARQEADIWAKLREQADQGRAEAKEEAERVVPVFLAVLWRSKRQRLFPPGLPWFRRYQRPLVPRQEEFVRAFTCTWNATWSAKFAGYSSRTADVIGCRLLRHPEVRAEILRIQERMRTGRSAREMPFANAMDEDRKHVGEEALAVVETSKARATRKPRKHYRTLREVTGMTRLQRRFVRAYLRLGNASAAARAAGYTGPVDVTACRLLKIPSVKAAIERGNTPEHSARYWERRALVAEARLELEEIKRRLAAVIESRLGQCP